MDDLYEYIKKSEDLKLPVSPLKLAMEKSFNIIFSLIAVVTVIGFIYYLGLFYLAVIIFSLAGIIAVTFVFMLFSCAGKSGCISGVMLLPVLLLSILGSILMGIDLLID